MSVDGQRTPLFGWSRISHESQIVTYCVALGGVLLSPAAKQDYPTKFAVPTRPQPAGFGPREPQP